MRRAAFSAVLVLGLGVTQAAWAQCTKDTDCKGERICSAGVCADAPPAPAPEQPPAPVEAPPAYAPAVAAPPAYAPVPVAPAPVIMSAPEAPNRRRRRSTGMYVTGIVLTSTGGLTLLGAGIVGMINAYCVDHAKSGASATSTADELETCNGLALAFWSTLIPGIALTAVGIPLWSVGGEEVQVTRLRLVPQLGPNRAGAALRLDL